MTHIVSLAFTAFFGLSGAAGIAAPMIRAQDAKAGVVVHRVRKKLGQQEIVTGYGRGYRIGPAAA